MINYRGLFLNRCSLIALSAVNSNSRIVEYPFSYSIEKLNKEGGFKLLYTPVSENLLITKIFQLFTA